MSVSSISVYAVPGLAKAGAVQVNCNNAVVSVSGASVSHKSTRCDYKDTKIECVTTLSANSAGTISSISYNLQCDNNTVMTVNFTCSGLNVRSGDVILIKVIESYSL
jgi:hypothetical protein